MSAPLFPHRSEKTVLSFDATHALTSCLLAADAVHGGDWHTPPTLLLIQDHPLPAHPGTRETRVVEIPLPADGCLPRVLTDLAAAIASAPDTTNLDVDLAAVAGLLAEPIAGLRLLGWGVRYDDLVTAAGGLRRVRYVDAVDIDERSYQLTRLHGETQPVVLVDDHPDPDDPPATHPALAALVTAALGRQVRA
jgi:hypothetical protein